MYYIVGLGNPGEEYESTRHNAGRLAVEDIAEHFGIGDFKFDKVLNAQKAKGTIAGQEVMLVNPETYMNLSGKSVAPLMFDGHAGGMAHKLKALFKGGAVGGKAKEAMEEKTSKLIVLQDDIDLPLGAVKIVFNRGAGGHNGIESIRKTLKTDAFIRIKIGIIPTTPDGELKKPQAGERVTDFVLGTFQKHEMEKMREVFKTVRSIIETILKDGLTAAYNKFN